MLQLYWHPPWTCTTGKQKQHRAPSQRNPMLPMLALARPPEAALTATAQDGKHSRKIWQCFSSANQRFSAAECRQPPRRNALASKLVFIGRKACRPSTTPDPRTAPATLVWPLGTSPWHRQTNTLAVRNPLPSRCFTPCITPVCTGRVVIHRPA